VPRLRPDEFPGIHVKDVFLDGHPVANPMEFDTDEGWVRCLLGYGYKGRHIEEVRHGRVTVTWLGNIETEDLVVLHGRLGTYHLARSGWTPACRSKDEITGFHYSKIGLVALPSDARAHLCGKCAKLIGVMTDGPGEQAGEGK